MAYTVRQTALLPAHAGMIPTVRVQTQKVVEALGNNLGAAAAALLTGEVE